jgi:hypothetical protein
MADELTRTDGQAYLDGPAHNEPMNPQTASRLRIAGIVAAIAVGLLSFFVVGSFFSKPETFAKTVSVLDQKKDTVMSLVAASTGSSAAISLLPGDAGTPIAEKLADFSEYFLLILCVLYAEKYLLTIIPYGVFKGLIPLTCALFIAGRIWNPRLLDKQGFKLLLIGIALLLVIPLSVRTSDMIYNTYQDSIDTTIASAEALTEETEELAAAKDANMIDRILNRLSETTGGMVDKASTVLNRFVETLAVMIVTSCLVPILVLLCFLWIVKQLTGIDFRDFSPRRGGRGPERRDEQRSEDQEQRSEDQEQRVSI